ncbi:MAG: Transcriptional regulator, LuxR family [Thermoanaerobacterales bacterium 50_218]|nr:MAG: Transcriptional regulator, LuxR family [Thermoanaerobacterales bacterium 50_218]HAA90474.1 hypothetical protein [Peptococcaceae bacterium]
MAAKLLLVSEQLLLRHAMALFIAQHPHWEVVGEATNSQETLQQLKTFEPNLLLVDAELNGEEIAEIAFAIEKMPGKNWALFAPPSSKTRLIKLARYKAKGYLTTELSPQEFLSFLQQIAEGKPIISPSLLPEMLTELATLEAHPPKPVPKLTPREKEVLRKLIFGATNREIANSLVISEYTVKNHIHNIMDKFQVSNRAQLIFYALTHGLIEI